ncbi:serine/threonine protein kinase [Salinibacillus kushneri]|uniref:Serine/threonine protein kinase n=1 Tax=Salinibacillus kushneri TaxID=237682 RepID=A0A1I0JIX4_9BACI|nr:protein kinase [Salinibacillus kushneri]SEU10299.1 serine/threonine protein kinase [Salinibacillus kushneri]
MGISTKKPVFNLRPGTKIRGKWHQNTYQIVKVLGSGAIGTVYLALFNQRSVALKISDQPSAITTEVNVLKAFEKAPGNRLGPSLIDVDDWAPTNADSYSFYVMEYLKGHNLNEYIQQKGEDWLGILIIQLLGDLHHLHQLGWVFGDLKPENLLVTQSPARLRWIDVGGTTKKGRAVKEYTEFYDRGYWGLGSRKADPAYDLFAVAMVMIQVYYPGRFEKGANPYQTLMKKIKANPQLRHYDTCLEKALRGQYTSSTQMQKDLAQKLVEKRKNPIPKSHPVRPSSQRQTSSIQQDSSPPKWMESIGIASVTGILFVFYMLLQIISGF